MKKMSNFLFAIMICLTASLLQGCQDNKQIETNQIFKENHELSIEAQNRFKQLTEYVNSGKKGQYALALSVAMEKVKKDMPNSDAIAELEKQFTLDMTTKGTVYQSIKKDYEETLTNLKISRFKTFNPNENYDKNSLNNYLYVKKELFLLLNRLKPKVYDEHFIDYINTLAAISPQVKPVVENNIPKDSAIGSSFVGNPAYGHWEKDKNGNEHWSFFEQYMYFHFLNNLFTNQSDHYYSGSHYRYKNYSEYKTNPYLGSPSPKYRYDNWHNKRGYSYYTDSYVQKYSSAKAKAKYNSMQSNLTKKYNGTITENKQVSKYHSYQSNLIRVSKSNNLKNLSHNPSFSSGK